MPKTKQYAIGNPNGFPKGTQILSFQGQKWYEGDAFVQPEGMATASVAKRIAQGYIVEVSGG